ncbi:hypothetical protein KR50_32010 [Jeotgalibacillus campisalis]|uniref:Uncharacterized protein n=1 Tax=Jeotgalibacillus campisalis TaxID=220754 RepID=A0A0C2VGN6_9BACL|nr:hypothetical protein KR50_32010 [Jeotgalibacillus campisalis]
MVLNDSSFIGKQAGMVFSFYSFFHLFFSQAIARLFPFC